MRKKPDDNLRQRKSESFFVKSRLLRLPQQDDAWEADFRALPMPMTQTETHYLGLVVGKKGGSVRAELPVQGTPNAGDLATLLTHALHRPKTKDPHRPRRILVRKNPRWKELFPAMEELGIEVVVQSDLPAVKAAFQDYLRQLREVRRSKMVRPTAAQQGIEELFPAVARWVDGYGHIEIGDQEGFGFVVRALDYGGLIFEDDRPQTLAEALAALEKGLRKWFDDEGIDLE